jgi:hypothetical protein
MSDIFDKLKFDLKNFKDEKHLQKALYKKIYDSQFVLTQKYFEENISSDFEKLSRIYQEKKKKSLEVVFFKKDRELSIKSYDYFNPEVVKKQISLWFLFFYPDKDEKLEKLKKYKISNDNMYFSVSWSNGHYYSVSILTKNHKIFYLKEKEKAYEHFNDLFKSKILTKED